MMALVETAGGLLSPCPSGTTQAFVFRPLRFPADLVGDSKLGGISSTLPACEALNIRGYSVASILMFGNESESLTNEKSVPRNVDKDTDAYLAPSVPLPDAPVQAYFGSRSVSKFFMDLSHIPGRDHEIRFRALLYMKDDAKKVFCYPFTQHCHFSDVTCNDSGHGETFTRANKHGYYHLVDGMGVGEPVVLGTGTGKQHEPSEQLRDGMETCFCPPSWMILPYRTYMWCDGRCLWRHWCPSCSLRGTMLGTFSGRCLPLRRCCSQLLWEGSLIMIHFVLQRDRCNGHLLKNDLSLGW